jgi:hypothetical protein
MDRYGLHLGSLAGGAGAGGVAAQLGACGPTAQPTGCRPEDEFNFFTAQYKVTVF